MSVRGDTLFKEIPSRTRQLRKAFKPKPVAWILALWLIWSRAKNLWNHTPVPFHSLVLACLALFLVILYTIPDKSVRLLPKRGFAFLIDLALLSVFTVGVMHFLYEFDVVEPSAIVSMGIVWAWFVLFVLADWILKGTPGQLMLSLRVKKLPEADFRSAFIQPLVRKLKLDEANFLSGFTTSLIRNLLTILIPVVIAGRLLIVPLAYSRLEKILRLGAGYALLAVVPVSIAFTGGHSLPDLLLRVAVIPKRSRPSQYPVLLGKKRWVSLLVASAVTGAILGLAQNLNNELAWKQAAPAGMTTAKNDPVASAWLWPRLLEGIPDSGSFVQHVEVLQQTGALPPDTYDSLGSTPCSIARTAPGKDFLVEAQVRIFTPSSVKGYLYGNLARIADSQAPANKLPTYLLFNLATREDFGAFTFTRVESSVLCLARVDGEPQSRFFMTDGSDRVMGSISGLSVLALGELGIYAQAERLPIWSRHR